MTRDPRPAAPPPPGTPVSVVDPVRSDAARAVVRVRARRAARVAGAVALLGGFAVVVVDAATDAPLDAVLLLLQAWIGAALSAGVAWCVVRALGRPDPARTAALDRGSVGELVGLAAPMVAVCLVAPLSLHAVVSLLLGCGPSAATFDDWVQVSLLIVGHAHVALAIRAALDARALAEDRAVASPLRAVLVASIVACVPGALLYAIPPVLVAVTGAAFVPALYAAARRWRDTDRALLVERGARAVRARGRALPTASWRP